MIAKSFKLKSAISSFSEFKFEMNFIVPSPS